MLKVEFNIEPTLEKLKYWIEYIEKKVINNLSDFWDGWASKIVIEETARIFATQGYGTWAPLSDKYAMWKSKVYPGRTMLRAKDVYFRASTRKGMGGNLFLSTPTEMTWGVDPTYFEGLVGYPYPYVLEKGNRSGTTPPRPVWALLVISVQLQQNLIKGLNDYLHKRINEETKKVYK